MSPKARLLASAAVLIGVSLPAHGQTTQPSKPAVDATETVVVIGEANETAATVVTRVAVEALETPYTVSLLPGRIIEDSAARTLSDALRYAGTVGGTDNFGNAGEFFSSRGFQLSAGNNYFRDGLRYRKYGQTPLYDIKRIEILRGPASILYGALEPGGVVNIVSKRPEEDPATRLSLRAGEANFGQVRVDTTGPLAETINYRVQALHEQSGSFRDLVDSQSQGVTGAIEFEITPTTLLTARASIFDDERTADRGTVMSYQTNGRFTAANSRKFDFAPIPRSRFIGEDFAVNNFQDVNYSISLRQQVGENWEVRGDIVRSEQQEDRVYIWAISADQIVDANGLLTRQIGDWVARLEGTLGRVEVAGEFDIGPTKHRLLFGGEFEHFDNRRTNDRFQFASINIYNPAYLAARPVNGTRTLNSPYGSLFESTSAYVQDVVEIGEHFVVLAGVRYDKVTDTNTLTNVERFSTDGWTPQVGFVWRPTEFISPYISYTRSFVPQTGVDRFGDPFEPEKGEQYEAGVKWDLRAFDTLVTAAVFQLDRENLPVNDVGFEPFQRLSGLQRSKGLELSIDTAPIEGLRVNLNYNYLAEAEFVNDNTLAGKSIPNAPEHALGLFVRYDFTGALDGFSLNGGVTHIGQRYGISSNIFYLPEYTLADLGARYRLNDRISFTTNLRNMFDETYYTGSINATTVNVGQPRTLTVGIDLAF